MITNHGPRGLPQVQIKEEGLKKIRITETTIVTDVISGSDNVTCNFCFLVWAFTPTKVHSLVGAVEYFNW